MMGQIAFLVEDGTRIEAFSASDAAWDCLVALQSGKLVMPVSEWPAVAKVNEAGLRVFTHAPGFKGLRPARESNAETRLKIALTNTARDLGFEADYEVTGESLDGEIWSADVVFKAPNGKRFALLSNFSNQPLEAYLKTAGMSVAWFLPANSEGKKLDRIVKSRWAPEEVEFYRSTRIASLDVEQLLFFSHSLTATSRYPSTDPVLQFRDRGEVSGFGIRSVLSDLAKGLFFWDGRFWRNGVPPTLKN